MMNPSNPALNRQRGLSMLLALIALLVLSLTAVALVRSVDTGTLIVGNIGFKQDTIEASSAGAEAAITWLNAAGDSVLSNDVAGVAGANEAGYYSFVSANLDPTGANTTAANKLALVNWREDKVGGEPTNCVGIPADTYASCAQLPSAVQTMNGNMVQWIIVRLCSAAGGTESATCTFPDTSGTGVASDVGEVTAGGRISDIPASPYYRIIVRTAGPRNTVSYTETMVHF